LRALDYVALRNTTLATVGDGPEREKFEKLATNLDTADQITFLGFLENYKSVLAHMHAADVFAPPSTNDGLGITYVGTITVSVSASITPSRLPTK
jgi:glycosyltransferase involved in cell wall biosynthesis